MSFPANPETNVADVYITEHQTAYIYYALRNLFIPYTKFDLLLPVAPINSTKLRSGDTQRAGFPFPHSGSCLPSFRGNSSDLIPPNAVFLPQGSPCIVTKIQPKDQYGPWYSNSRNISTSVRRLYTRPPEQSATRLTGQVEKLLLSTRRRAWCRRRGRSDSS